MSFLHEEREHSKFSASGAERWFNCPGSVEIQEGLPDKDNVWSVQGTQAHEVLERILKARLKRQVRDEKPLEFRPPKDMVAYGNHAADQILKIHKAHPGSELMVEERVTLEFIHPEAFGSLDAAVLDHFGTLHILDYKYGMMHVSPRENLQFIFYSLAVSFKHFWNFRKVRMWTLQPRTRGFDGYLFWEITMKELKHYIPKFDSAVARVLRYPNKYNEGSWCHFCKAKSICPLKTEAKAKKFSKIFKAVV